MNQPRAKKESPASMADPQAWEYHLLYCLMANLHCSLSVAASGFLESGGFGNWDLCPPELPILAETLDDDSEEGGGGGGGRFWGELLGFWGESLVIVPSHF